MPPPPHSADTHPEDTPESLIGQPILDAWVPTAVASSGTGCQVLRAKPVRGESKVLVHVVQLHVDTEDDASEADRSAELEMLRRVRHSGVLPLLMAGRLPDGRHVIVTPATGATTLATQLITRPPRLPAVLRIASQVARALKAIHDGVGVYGPLTPEHILLTPDAHGNDEVRLLPVWWAWRHGRDAAEAEPWQPVTRIGAPRRMADDVYALGAIIWHAIAGRPPRDADAMETLPNHVTAGPVPPVPLLSTVARRKIAPAIDAVVASMLSQERSSRPTDLGAVADRLDDMVHQLEGGGDPAIAPPMIMATPVPVGGQLRQRSLVLPVAPPEATEDPPTAPSETRALKGTHLPEPRKATESPPPQRESTPAPFQMMRPTLPGNRLEDAPTIIEGDEDDGDDPTTRSARALDPSEADSTAGSATRPDPKSTSSTEPQPSPPAGPPLWLFAAGGVLLLSLGLLAVLYLAGLLG